MSETGGARAEYHFPSGFKKFSFFLPNFDGELVLRQKELFSTDSPLQSTPGFDRVLCRGLSKEKRGANNRIVVRAFLKMQCGGACSCRPITVLGGRKWPLMAHHLPKKKGVKGANAPLTPYQHEVFYKNEMEISSL